MILKIENGDLFHLKNTHYLAHCISQDMGMNAGIAVKFNVVYNMRNKLKNIYTKLELGCILVDNVFNLVTKEKYWGKPNYASIEHSLIKMRDIVKRKKIKKIAMPKIGCGLDKLKWNKVKQIIENVFYDVDIEIIVRYL